MYSYFSVVKKSSSARAVRDDSDYLFSATECFFEANQKESPSARVRQKKETECEFGFILHFMANLKDYHRKCDLLLFVLFTIILFKKIK